VAGLLLDLHVTQARRLATRVESLYEDWLARLGNQRSGCNVGAVRAMEFDINAEWHTLITYTHENSLIPRLVEPQSQQSPERYLVPDDRDFFAVYKRLPGPVTDPLK
jgi:hypothetical protein